MLFEPSGLFVFICFMIEVTSSSFVGFKKNELVTDRIFQVVLVICICMNNFVVNVFSNWQEEVVKGISQDFGASFCFVVYFYRFNLFFLFFFDIYNGSYSVLCSLGIIFVFLKEWLVKICLIDSCNFVNEIFVMFEFLEECLNVWILEKISQ